MLSSLEIGGSFVCAMCADDMQASIPHLLRSYRAPSHVLDCQIVRAVRATTAAPTFFERAYLDESQRGPAYVDGGMGCNNPIDWVLAEAEAMFPGRKVASIISIGTGHPGTISIPTPGWFQRTLPLDVIEAVKRIATDCEQKANEIERRFASTPEVYFRFNVEHGLQKVGLGEWERLGELEGITRTHIRLAHVHGRLEQAVRVIQGRRGVIPTEHISTAHVNLA